MAEFTANLQCYKPTLPYLDMESNIELMNQFSELNPNVLQNNSNLGLQSFMNSTVYSDEYSFAHQEQAEFPVLNNSVDNNQVLFQSESSSAVPIAHQSTVSNKKRKSIADTDGSSGNSSTLGGLGGENEGHKRKNGVGTKGKKGKNNGKDADILPKEVIHVRARRGQATDSHSLAERVRREKINERLRCLQHLVPGCYKTMGMSVMLDEIIKYVQSLQNQIEFLSMKLTAASTFFDFNLDMESPNIFQGTNASDTQEMERMLLNRDEGYGGLSRTQVPTFPL
ncbi:hypothetical protein C5167_031452 [Papaver somniferum]|uniref:BHLH domain-containing protein n=1 Tax=Papaver somniferum TaxID=3469 RepID=A0A4Y7K8E1_PAPSO|nr:transcription factor BEE 1-like [Papaver somniferum]RZC68199.1 hypothetical protein C5167_031452 [Papaver somniferum]